MLVVTSVSKKYLKIYLLSSSSLLFQIEKSLLLDWEASVYGLRQAIINNMNDILFFNMKRAFESVRHQSADKQFHYESFSGC